MSWCRRPAVIALLSLVGASANALPMTADVNVLVDQADGRSVDAGFSLSPTSHLTLSAGAGHSEGGPDTGDLSGNLYDAGISLHGEPGGFSLRGDSFDDGANYQTRTLGARAWVDAGDFEFALLGRRREHTVDVTLQLPQRTLSREVEFAATGYGLEIDYTGASFTTYLSALAYDYDDDFDDFIALANSPQLARRPLIEALVGTFLTQSQGAIDRQFGAGVERVFGRHSLALDVASVHDAVLDAGSVSVALTWRFAQSARLDWNLSAGLVDSETYGDIAFIGAGVGIGN